jgi:hypothetical protein
MSQQSKLASWQQLKVYNTSAKVEEPTNQEIILTPSIVEEEISVDLTIQPENLEENIQVTTAETVKKPNKKGTVNV